MQSLTTEIEAISDAVLRLARAKSARPMAVGTPGMERSNFSVDVSAISREDDSSGVWGREGELNRATRRRGHSRERLYDAGPEAAGAVTHSHPVAARDPPVTLSPPSHVGPQVQLPLHGRPADLPALGYATPEKMVVRHGASPSRESARREERPIGASSDVLPVREGKPGAPCIATSRSPTRVGDRVHGGGESLHKDRKYKRTSSRAVRHGRRGSAHVEPVAAERGASSSDSSTSCACCATITRRLQREHQRLTFRLLDEMHRSESRSLALMNRREREFGEERKQMLEKMEKLDLAVRERQQHVAALEHELHELREERRQLLQGRVADCSAQAESQAAAAPFQCHGSEVDSSPPGIFNDLGDQGIPRSPTSFGKSEASHSNERGKPMPTEVAVGGAQSGYYVRSTGAGRGDVSRHRAHRSAERGGSRNSPSPIFPEPVRGGAEVGRGPAATGARKSQLVPAQVEAVLPHRGAAPQARHRSPHAVSTPTCSVPGCYAHTPGVSPGVHAASNTRLSRSGSHSRAAAHGGELGALGRGAPRGTSRDQPGERFADPRTSEDPQLTGPEWLRQKSTVLRNPAEVSEDTILAVKELSRRLVDAKVFELPGESDGRPDASEWKQKVVAIEGRLAEMESERHKQAVQLRDMNTLVRLALSAAIDDSDTTCTGSSA